MGSPYKIPKKKQLSDSSVIGMTSPLSRLQNNTTSKSNWTREVLNGKKPNGNGCINGKRDVNIGSPEANSWRPKRASDSICQHEGDKHPLSAKKQRELNFTETVGSSESEDKKDNEDKNKKAVSLASEANGTNTQESTINKGVENRQNGQSAHSSSDQCRKKEVPEEHEKTPKNRGASSVPGGKTDHNWPFSGKKLRLRLSSKTYQRIKQSSTEPIVLSSDDEDGADKQCTDAVSSASAQQSVQKTSSSATFGEQFLSPSIIELAFSTLHFGTTRALANGLITITEDSISIPLKGAVCDGDKGDSKSVSVSIVPSELQAYGIWKKDGCRLIEQQDSSSSSFLFFILTDAQARLLHTELSSIHNTHTASLPSPFVLVVLVGHLEDIQHVSLVSLIEMMALKTGRSELSNPLSLAEGMKRLQSHPRGFHLLTLLRHKMGTNQESQNGTKNGKTLGVISTRQASLRSGSKQQSLARRLIQYPPPPSKGGITVTTEDLECLRDGEFLNDVIIDFYLKYLQLESENRDLADRSHIFSSFFYKQLTRKDNIREEEAGGTAQYRRHQRVRTWTRNVDIFSKDFLFIPVNQEAHWYLVVICFPGLLQTDCVTWRTSQAGSTEETKGRTKDGKSYDLPDCTARSCKKETVTRRPCILIMDSLKLSYHYRIYMLLREYLQVEWEMRRGTPRVFNEDSIKGSHCKVPLQDNSSDCGLYLLQYVESFLENPVVHFDLPLRLERWFPRQQVHRKRAELRELVLQLYRKQGGGVVQNSSSS
ncbi:sentrin-specific protease 7b [Trichomycterus rosablanca]|uniref:sentrin-specific protease 7b n=1 Tax=Trichomycterus rosablanca TaxID=2290929 RepID=UPI002F35A9EC